MKQRAYIGKKHNSFYRGFSHWVLLMVLFFWGFEGEAQQAVQRVYADSENHGGTILVTNVANASDAFDHDLKTYSTLSITALGSVWQQLEFTGTEQPSASDAIRIKIGTQSALLGLLTGVSVRAYNNGSPVGTSVQLSALISLLNGADQQEIVFTPGVAFDAIRLINTAVSLGGGLDIYEAYFYKPIPGQTACNQPVDILYGSTGNIAGAFNAVENPENAKDNNTTTYTTIRANVSALNRTHLTALFPIASSAGDYIKITIQNPDGGLLDANLLATNFTIRTYHDNTDNGALALDPALLRLSLFPGSTDKQILIYPVSQSFNRIQVSLGEGLVTALDDLWVYEISRLAAGPDVSGLPISGDIEVCDNENINLSVENPVTGAIYKWYSQPIGGTPIATSDTYSPGMLAIGDHTYYVSQIEGICTEESHRTPVNLKVLKDIQTPILTINNTND